MPLFVNKLSAAAGGCGLMKQRTCIPGSHALLLPAVACQNAMTQWAVAAVLTMRRKSLPTYGAEVVLRSSVRAPRLCSRVHVHALVSMACRAVFMATGMAAATVTQTAAALGIAPTAATLAMPTSDVSNSGALLAATAVLTFMGLARAAQGVSGGVCF